MKIILATPIYPPEIGGPATYVKELSERLANKHKITIIAYTDVREPFNGTRLIAVSKRSPLFIRLVKFFIEVLKTAKDNDLIYVQNAMAAGLPVALVNLLTGKPFILKFVGDEAWERASQLRRTSKKLEEFLREPEGGFRIKLMMLIQKFVLKRASIVTTPSEYLGEEIIKAYKIKKNKVKVNYNAAEESQVLPFEPHLTKHQVLTTARLVKWKGVDGIIKSISLVKEKFPDASLIIAGDGPEMDRLRDLAKGLGIEKNVKFLGNVSRAETWQLRKNSELYVLNSTYEGLPHTVLTSFAAEIPTIATNIPGTNEAIYHLKTGILVRPENEKELAEAIELLFKDKDLAKQLVEGGLKLLKEKFSWKSHLENLELIFKSVLYKPGNKF